MALKLRDRLVVFCVTAALLLGAASGLSLAAVGRIEEVRGSVKLQRGSERFVVRTGMPLHEGDRLTSYRDSSAVFTLGEHWVRLGPDTSLLVARVESAKRQYRLFLWLGRLWLFVKRSLAAVDFRVETPAAIAGVRGTLFAVEVSARGSTWVGVAEGRVAVWTPDGGVEIVLDSGYGVTVESSGPPGRPKKLKPGEVGGNDLKEKGEKDHGNGPPPQEDRGKGHSKGKSGKAAGP